MSCTILVVGGGVKTIAFFTKLLFSQFGISTVISVSPPFSLAAFFGGSSVGTSQMQWA
ncbi:hypothetical protein [Peribacillus loiseleuriae]|uniref:hypothetical protein n=1 Tax=Peribacillus loiseleuriae TaxID=1679170 RepID=UPI003CFF771C